MKGYINLCLSLLGCRSGDPVQSPAAVVETGPDRSDRVLDVVDRRPADVYDPKPGSQEQWANFCQGLQKKPR
jgi:hypothetical protein